jgi:hypothetical protein
MIYGAAQGNIWVAQQRRPTLLWWGEAAASPWLFRSLALCGFALMPFSPFL